jgi:hypothetical protein
MDRGFTGLIVDCLPGSQGFLLMELFQCKTRAPSLAAFEINRDIVGLDESIDDRARCIGRFASGEQNNRNEKQQFRRRYACGWLELPCLAPNRVPIQGSWSSALMRLLFEERFELGARVGRCAFGGSGAAAHCKKFTKIGSFLIYYAFGGRFPALVVISGVVMFAISAYVQRPVA